MDFSIREATQEDYQGLCAVFEEVDALHREALPHMFQEPDGPAWTKAFFSGIMADENAALLVAESDAQIIGLVLVLIRETPDFPVLVPRRYAVIENLVVLQNFRRSGVGQSLVERAHRWAADQKITQVELNVWEFNKGAVAFYEKLGYATASRQLWKSLR